MLRSTECFGRERKDLTESNGSKENNCGDLAELSYKERR